MAFIDTNHSLQKGQCYFDFLDKAVNVYRTCDKIALVGNFNPEKSEFSEASFQRCSKEKVLWKYVANLQENNQISSCFATLLKSDFVMGVLL